MFRIIPILLLLISGCSFKQTVTAQTYGQPSVKLLYLVDSGYNYLIPYVEDVLWRMEDSRTGKLIFDTIVSLRKLNEGKAILAGLLDNSRDNKGATIRLIMPNDTVANLIQKSNKILQIKVNALADLIEYQFTLYNVDASQNPSTLSYVKNSSIFINPRNGKYKDQILTALKILFPQANYPPAIKLSINKEPISCANLTYTETDTITVEAIVYDKDPTEEGVNFHWSQDPTNLPLNIDRKEKSQTLFGLKKGQYKLYCFADDGIDSTKLDSVTINIVDQPQLKVEDAIFFSKRSLNVTFQSFLFNKHLQLVHDPTMYFSIRKFPAVCNEVEYVLNLETFSKKQFAVYKDTALISDSSFCKNADSTASFKYELYPKRLNISELEAGVYKMQFSVRKGSLKTSIAEKKVNLYKRSAIAYYQEYMFQPFFKNSILNSSFNLSAGLSAKLSPILSITGTGGFNVINNIAKRFYGAVDLNITSFDIGMPVGGAYSLLIYRRPEDDAATVAYGVKLISKSLMEESQSSLHIGLGLYYIPTPYQGNSNLLISLFYIGRVFFSKE